MKLRGAPGDCEAEASAARFRGKDRIEDAIANAGRNTGALVADVDPTELAVAGERHLDRAAPVHRLCRIQQHVQEGCAQQVAVAVEGDVALDPRPDLLSHRISAERGEGIEEE